MVEKEVRVHTPPVEFTDASGQVIGINGARANQLLAQRYPSRFMRARLKDLGLSIQMPPQRQTVESDF